MHLVFDLDGTIADYGASVTQEVADALNNLGPIHIISGGKLNHIANATQLIKEKTLHSMADIPGNHRIDMSAVCGVSKGDFFNYVKYQTIRRDLILALRECFGEKVFAGGRSTIDLMLAKDKGDVLREISPDGDVVYFYDNQWADINAMVHNDYPAMRHAKTAIRTDFGRVMEDIKPWL